MNKSNDKNSTNNSMNISSDKFADNISSDFEYFTVYTDGSCLKNPGGAGGWAFVLIENNDVEIIGYGSDPSTTNNRMELTAVIRALQNINYDKIIIYTDSQWVIKCANGEWRRKANLDLWMEYDQILNKRKINYVWIRGHNGDKYNEIVDNIAREEARKLIK